MSTEYQPPEFTPYQVEVGGQLLTVLDPEGTPGYRVQMPNGEVQLFAAPSGTPCEANAASDLENQPVRVPTVEQAWEAFLAGSIEDPVTHLRLKANRQARNDFIGQATLLQAALAGGAITGSSPVSVWDKDNVEHPLTVSDCLSLLVRYGLAWQSAFVQLAP